MSGALTIRLERDSEDGGWTAFVVERPGCVSDGRTQPEALRNLSDALCAVIVADLCAAPR